MDALALLLMVSVLAAGLYGVRWIERVTTLTAKDLRRVGVVVKSVRALDGMAELIGYYMGADIYDRIVFKGVSYQFVCVAPPAVKAHLRGRQLYLEPGLLYASV